MNSHPTRPELISYLRDNGRDELANRLEAVTDEQRAEFEHWLEDPAHRQQWYDALDEARKGLA